MAGAAWGRRPRGEGACPARFLSAPLRAHRKHQAAGGRIRLSRELSVALLAGGLLEDRAACHASRYSTPEALSTAEDRPQGPAGICASPRLTWCPLTRRRQPPCSPAQRPARMPHPSPAGHAPGSEATGQAGSPALPDAGPGSSSALLRARTAPWALLRGALGAGERLLRPRAHRRRRREGQRRFLWAASSVGRLGGSGALRVARILQFVELDRISVARSLRTSPHEFSPKPPSPTPPAGRRRGGASASPVSPEPLVCSEPPSTAGQSMRWAHSSASRPRVLA